MNSWIPKKNILIATIAVALGAVTLYIIGLFIINAQTQKLSDSYQNSETEASQEQKLWNISAIIENHKVSIQAIRDFFIPNDGDVAFIKRIEDIGKSAQVTSAIDSIDLKKDKASMFKDDVSVRMHVEGTWKNVMTFVHNLERMPFGVSIKSLNLSSEGPNNWSGVVEFISYKEK